MRDGNQMPNYTEQLKAIFAERNDPPDVFLCHSSADKRFVSKLANDLKSLGVHVWFDEWRLQVGDGLHNVIGEALERSAFIAVVLSPSSIESKWCQSELEQALTREKREGKKVALPLLYRRVQPPPFLEGRLYLDFSHSYLRALARLTGFLRAYEPERVNMLLKIQKPKSVGDVAVVLDKCSPISRVNVLPAEKYLAIREILKATGVDIGRQMFSVADGANPTNLIVEVDRACASDHSTVRKSKEWLASLLKESPSESNETEQLMKD